MSKNLLPVDPSPQNSTTEITLFNIQSKLKVDFFQAYQGIFEGLVKLNASCLFVRARIFPSGEISPPVIQKSGNVPICSSVNGFWDSDWG